MILVLACAVAVTGIAAAVIRGSLTARREARLVRQAAQAELLCEAGAMRARHRLLTEPDYRSETWTPDLSSIGYAFAEVVIESGESVEPGFKEFRVQAGVGGLEPSEPIIHKSLVFVVRQ